MDNMKKTAMRLQIAGLFFLIFPYSPLASAAPADPAQVENIMRMENGEIDSKGEPIVAIKADSDSDFAKKQIDAVAKSETLIQSVENNGWNDSNPQWAFVFHHIRADVDKSDSQILDAEKNFTHSLSTEVASHLDQSDVNTILDYFRSSSGRAYLGFTKKIDFLFNDVTESLMGNLPSFPSEPRIPEKPYGKPSSDRTRNLERMVLLSRAFIIVSGTLSADDPGYSSFLPFANKVVALKDPELDSLYLKYGDNLSDFEAFTKTDAAKHYYKALSDAVKALGTPTNPLVDILKTFEKHRDEWYMLYREAIVPSTTLPMATGIVLPPTIGTTPPPPEDHRPERIRALLPPPGEGWKIDGDIEKKVAATVLSTKEDPLIFHCYTREGKEVAVFVKVSSNAQMLANRAASMGYDKNGGGPVLVNSYQGAFYPSAGKSGGQAALQVYVGNELIVSFISRTLPRDWLIEFANTVDFDKMRQIQLGIDK